MNKLSIVLSLVIILFSCKSIENNKNIAIEVIEGKGLLNQIEIGFTKKLIKKAFPSSDNCEIIVGKYYKVNDNANYIDDRKIIFKKTENQKCYNDKGFNIFFDEDVVSKIIFSSKKYQTKKGMKIGDNIKKITKLYGDEFRHSYFEFLFNKKENIGLRNMGLDILYYDNLGLGFVMNKSGKKVKKIIIFNKEPN
jgi:hypothetical protein